MYQVSLSDKQAILKTRFVILYKQCIKHFNYCLHYFQVMAKVEELNKSMGPAYKIADQVKDVKRLLDLFEATLNSKQ